MYDKGVCYGYQKISPTNALTSGFTITAFPQVEAALIRVNSDTGIRFTLDGSVPSSTNGYPINDTDTQGFWIWGSGPVKNFMCAGVTTSAAEVDILYFGLAES